MELHQLNYSYYIYIYISHKKKNVWNTFVDLVKLVYIVQVMDMISIECVLCIWFGWLIYYMFIMKLHLYTHTHSSLNPHAQTHDYESGVLRVPNNVFGWICVNTYLHHPQTTQMDSRPALWLRVHRVKLERRVETLCIAWFCIWVTFKYVSLDHESG